MRERLAVIIRKEFLQALRDVRMRGLLIGPPVLQLIIFGYAANLDVDHVRIGWMDQDRTVESRELLSSFAGSNRFDVVALPSGEREMQDLLDRGNADAIIRVMPGFGRDVQKGRTTSVQVLVEGTNSNTAAIVTNYASSTVARYSREVLEDWQRQKLTAAAMRTGAPVQVPVPTLSARPRVWFNPDLRSRNYFVPGIVVNIITLVTMMLTSMAIVREKELGTMEQLMVTPIRPIELMLGKTLPFAIVGLFDVALIAVLARILFNIPFRGSVLFITIATLAFLMSTLGVGLFISTVSRTQQQAMMSLFLIFMPAFLLSGFAFPIRNMPSAVQYLTLLNPVRYYLEITRGTFLKGSGLQVLWPQVSALLVIGTTVLGASALRFRKTLD